MGWDSHLLITAARLLICLGRSLLRLVPSCLLLCMGGLLALFRLLSLKLPWKLVLKLLLLLLLCCLLLLQQLLLMLLLIYLLQLHCSEPCKRQ